MKYLLSLLLVSMIVIGLLSLKKDEQPNSNPVTGLPWQIDRLPDGNTRVFGITPGSSTLGEAIELLGDDLDVAIIAAPNEPGTLEAYFSHYSSGPITGKLILQIALAADALASMQQRAFQDRGTRRYHLHPDDIPLALQAPVSSITFIPSYNLDESIVQDRFGIPAEIIQVSGQQKHLLYPDKGLDLILNTKGKEVLQYLSPADFSHYRMQLAEKVSAVSGNP